MTVSIRTRACIAGFAAMLCCGPTLAELDEGLAALVKGDYAAAAKELRPLAERGDAEAQYRVGRMYEFGRGFPADKAQGIAWYRKAAAQGHSGAQQELGAIYASGDGVPKDDAQALAWFRKAADQGNPTAQYNLGLLYAKGAGVRVDNAQAVAWFRKSAAQGFAAAQFKLGLAYEFGEGVAKDPVIAYANYAIAARGGNPEFVTHRDALAASLSAAQARQGLAAASAWTVGQPTPASVAVPAPDRCMASGQLEGERFTAAHCAVSFMDDQRSVAIWFNEEPITPQERESFRTSSYADGNKGGKPRTMLQIMFCPGVKAIDFNSNHAKSPMAGLQRVFESPGDYKVERMTGEFRPGGTLSGKIVGSRGKTSWNLDFAVTLPTKDAAAGMSCGK